MYKILMALCLCYTGMISVAIAQNVPTIQDAATTCRTDRTTGNIRCKPGQESNIESLLVTKQSNMENEEVMFNMTLTLGSSKYDGVMTRTYHKLVDKKKNLFPSKALTSTNGDFNLVEYAVFSYCEDPFGAVRCSDVLKASLNNSKRGHATSNY